MPEPSASPALDQATAPVATRRWRLVISYEGGAWAGWQSQLNQRGIQDRVQLAVGKVVGAPVSVQGSGRTDAGVHALAQVAHFDAPLTRDLTTEAWVRALNANLPASIRVLGCEPAAEGFHARYSAEGKLYRYRIVRAAVLSPFEVGRAWQVYGPLDEAALEACLALLPGTHNFARLAANRGDEREKQRRGDPAATTRTIHRAAMQSEAAGEVLSLEFEGDGFLYKMVRLLVGSVIRVAQGRESVNWFADLLADPTGPKSPYCAPADGLYLVQVKY